MTNTFKKLRKKFRRRKMMAEKAMLERKQSTAARTGSYQSRLLRRRIDALKRVLTMTAIVVLAVLALVLYFQKRCYYDYKILKTSEQCI